MRSRANLRPRHALRLGALADPLAAHYSNRHCVGSRGIPNQSVPRRALCSCIEAKQVVRLPLALKQAESKQR
jgi:hypothetical protein